MAKLVDRVTRSYTGQLDNARLDQPLGTKDNPDQRILLALRPLPCHRHELSQVDGLAKVLSACSVLYLDTDLFQFW